MINEDYENTYECEDCGSTFIIKPETGEIINFCPHCGNEDKNTFTKTTIIE